MLYHVPSEINKTLANNSDKEAQIMSLQANSTLSLQEANTQEKQVSQLMVHAYSLEETSDSAYTTNQESCYLNNVPEFSSLPADKNQSHSVTALNDATKDAVTSVVSDTLLIQECSNLSDIQVCMPHAEESNISYNPENFLTRMLNNDQNDVEDKEERRGQDHSADVIHSANKESVMISKENKAMHPNQADGIQLYEELITPSSENDGLRLPTEDHPFGTDQISEK
ncbi:hypothetical protein EGW08_012057 [Elysia chlorotica]|uniref:Uncharacterized protein n=1 Tax=Elysia chlorotica TaxID=188477 RepID=A0A433TF20_ELYCH|nr:hypothetical protein EGW08_012057 [Elysia chlorotica]